MKLTIRPRESLFIYKDWAKEIPMLRPCWKGEQLERSMTALEDAIRAIPKLGYRLEER